MIHATEVPYGTKTICGVQTDVGHIEWTGSVNASLITCEKCLEQHHFLTYVRSSFKDSL